MIGLLNAFVWPLLARLTLPLTVLTLGLAALVLNGILVTWALDLLPGAEVAGVPEGIVITVVGAATSLLLTTLTLCVPPAPGTIVLMATVLSKRGSKAPYTSPMPPRPNNDSI